MEREISFYERLGVHKDANPQEIRAAFRKLVLRMHPDHGGNDEAFIEIQTAYEVLADPRKKRIYDRHGQAALSQSAEELLTQEFRGGALQTQALPAEDRLQQEVEKLRRENDALQRQVALVKPEKSGLDATSFEAWMRNRNPGQLRTVTADTILDAYGVAEGSYAPVEIQPLTTTVARYRDLGELSQVLERSSEPLPTHLAWGEALVHMLAAPITPTDRQLARWHWLPGDEVQSHPVPAGAQGVGVVLHVGPGVEGLKEGDLVMPKSPLLGTFRTIAIWNSTQLFRVPPTTLAPDALATFMSVCTAYRLLEDFGSLRPGDTILQSGAESAVGQAVIQLCRLLKINTLNLVQERDDFEEIADVLRAQGATHVWRDTGSILSRIERVHAALPRLGLDAVGGRTTARIAECLRPSSTLVVHGVDAGKIDPFPINAVMFQGIELRGFWLYGWLKEHPEGFLEMADRLLPLMEEEKISIPCSRWEQLDASFESALQDRHPSVVLQFASREDALRLPVKSELHEEAPTGDEAQTVGEWLEELGLPELAETFIQHGYDRLELIRQAGLRKEDLEFMGIRVPLQQRLLLEAFENRTKH